MDGILLVDKPVGWSSHDVVAKTRGILKAEAGHKVKVGHTGTLDPLASGLMVLVVGSYCKRASEFSSLDKTYEVGMKLGQNSSTGDEEGEKTVISDNQPANPDIQKALKEFIGDIEQIPPAYSAIKIDGKRAYKLAREGKEIKLEPRKVTIHDIKLTDYGYPIAKFTASVSSGTYIRTLVEDIGEMLGVGAYTTDLRRTIVGDYSVDKSVTIEELTADNIQRI